MGWLDDYNPIANLSIAGTDVNNPSGVIVIVGPNSSGKTLLLEDIEHYFTTGQLSKTVCAGLAPHPPGQAQVIWDDLESRHYIRRIGPQPDTYTTYLSFLCGDKQPRQTRRKGRGENPQFNRKMFEEAVSSSSKTPLNNLFFQFIGSTLTGYLSLDVRRQICSPTPSFNHAQASPTLPLQGLQLNSSAQETLAEETGRVFGNAVWLDISTHNQYQLRVSGKPTRPPVGDMLNPLRAGDYFSIEQEGDGVQSYVGICISVLLGIRPVLLIDEPELCLHPPQAYNIGRFIGQHALPKHATFVSTHSSYVLRGILEAAKKVTVIRLTNRNRAFSARLLPNEELRVAVRNPRSRAEAVLDGLFAKAVIVVESDGDREVYQAAGESIVGFPSQEVHFVCVGGTGGFAEVCKLYNSLHVPVAVIADLDAICEPNKVELTLRALTRQPDKLSTCIEAIKRAANLVKQLPVSTTEADVIGELKRLAAGSYNWNSGDDNKLRSELKKIDNKLYRIHRLKKGGVSAYESHPEIRDALQETISLCKHHGLFLVPCGELEEWVPSLRAVKPPPSSLSKTERAYLIAELIREASSKTGDVWAFMEETLERFRIPSAPSAT